MKPTTISLLQKCKQEKKRFATITAYDYSFAKLFAEEGINVMLVGDSLGMTVQGHDSTLPVTVEDIAYHTRAVRRGAPACCFPICRLWPMPRRSRHSKTRQRSCVLALTWSKLKAAPGLWIR